MKSYLLFWKRAFDMSGVASRAQYWIAVLVNAAIISAILILFPILQRMLYERHMWDMANSMETVTAVVIGLYTLAAIIPAITLTVRRLHDHNFSGLLYLINFIPGVGSLIMFVFLCLGTVKTDNRWRMNDIQRGYVTDLEVNPLGDWQYEDFVYHMEYEEKNGGEDI